MKERCSMMISRDKIRALVRILSLMCILIILSGMSAPFCMANTAADSDLDVKSVSYDPDEKTITFRFDHKVEYKTDSDDELNVKVKVYRDDDTISTSIKKAYRTRLVLNTKKLKYGYKYGYVIKGIRKQGTKSYVTLKGTFRAIQ